MNKNEIIEAIRRIKIGYLATCDGNNQPYVRPMDMKTVYDGDIYFSTFCNTEKNRQIEKCQNVEAVFVENYRQFRIQGKAILIKSKEIREKFFKDNKGIAEMLKDGDDSVMLIYKLSVINVRYMGDDDETYSLIDWN